MSAQLPNRNNSRGLLMRGVTIANDSAALSLILRGSRGILSNTRLLDNVGRIRAVMTLQKQPIVKHEISCVRSADGGMNSKESAAAKDASVRSSHKQAVMLDV